MASTCNDPSFVSIDLSDEDQDFASVQEAIRANAATANSVELVCSFRDYHEHGFGLPASFSHITPVFMEMGRTLTSLRSISITVNHAMYDSVLSLRDQAAPFPIYALKHLLQLRANSLVSLKLLWGVHLVGSPSEFQETYEVLSKSKILKEFTMESCSVEVVQDEDAEMGETQANLPPFDRAEASDQLDSLIEALSDVDTLQELIISDVELTTTLQSPLVKLCHRPSGSTKELICVDLSGVNLSQQLCSILCGAPRISKLRLVDIRNKNDIGISPIANNLETNPFLQEFRIENSNEEDALSPSEAIRLLEMLQENVTLDFLEIDISCNKDHSQNGDRWTNAVKNISHLKRLNLHFYDRDYSRTSNVASSVLEGLKENQTLTHMRLNLCSGFGREDDDSASTEISQGEGRLEAELVNALQTNKVLQHVEMMRNDCDDVFSIEVQFWLTLNRCGRHYLETHLDDRVSWVNTVIEHKNEPRVTFYFLSTNPNVCQLAGSVVPQKRKLPCD